MLELMVYLYGLLIFKEGTLKFILDIYINFLIKLSLGTVNLKTNIVSYFIISIKMFSPSILYSNRVAIVVINSSLISGNCDSFLD